jgi:hypothetical protein
MAKFAVLQQAHYKKIPKTKTGFSAQSKVNINYIKISDVNWFLLGLRFLLFFFH